MTTDLRNPTVSDHERALLDGVPKRAFLAGRWDDGDGAFVVEDPGTAAPLCEVADAGPEHARRALDAAVAAQERWAATPSRVRSELLRSAFEVVQARADDLALLIVLESGKPLVEARAELDYGADFLRWYAEEAVRPHGDYREAPAGDKRILTSTHPVGPCLLITPWNFPLNRFLVHERVSEEFSSRFAERLAGLTIGRGTAPDAAVGPLIDAAARTRVEALVRSAVDDGAEVLCGGEPPSGPGYFYRPTLLANVPADAPIAQQEIFAPVAPISTFASEEEALRQANATDWGLVAFVHTRDVERALRVGDRLQVGMVGLNRGMVSDASAPFGGVKQSGLGREGGAEGLREYQDTRYLAMSAGARA